MSEWVIVGKLLGPYGIKGWIKLHSHTHPIDNIGTYNPLWIQRGGSWQAIDVEKVQRHGKGLVAKLRGCDDREQVPGFTGCEVAIKRDQLPALGADDFYWSDLEGLKVITVAGECLGVVDHLFETGSNDVLVVKPGADSIDSEQRLVPYVWEQVVKQVDLQAGSLTVDWDKDF